MFAAWWWPFGGKKSKPISSQPDLGKRAPIKVSDKPTGKEDQVSVERLQKLAKNGNANAQVALGKIYFDGLLEQKQNHKKAFELFTQAAEQGSPQAMFNLGLCYDGGFGIKKNQAEALRWYNQAAETGLPEAQLSAAILAERSGDYATALHFLKLRANAGDTGAMHRVASFLLNGLGGPANPEEAISYLLEAARQGDSRSQVLLADCYQSGIGVERNYHEMFNWLTLAAQDGDPEAQAKLGYCYQKGLGIAANPELAYSWFKTAATAAYGPALVHLGDCYRYGDGTALDYQKAYESYRSAAELNEPSGAFNLAVAYSEGMGAEMSETEAFKWMKKAADENLALAQIQLGLYLQRGYGIDKADPQLALEYFQKAALLDEPLAMLQSAKCYMEGTGTEKNPEKAKYWLAKAAALGNREALTLYEQYFPK